MSSPDALDELYGLPPGEFVERRDALAAAARQDGDTARAASIKALRKPTVAAALINALVRERAEAVSEFLDLGAQLQRAQDRGDGEQLRQLMRRRQQLMSELDKHVVELAGDRGLTATSAVGREIHTALLSALADETTAVHVREGRLQSTAVTEASIEVSEPAQVNGATNTAIDSQQRSVRRAAAERRLSEALAKAEAADRTVSHRHAEADESDAVLAELSAALDWARQEVLRAEQAWTTAEQKATAARRALADAETTASTLRQAASEAKASLDRE